VQFGARDSAHQVQTQSLDHYRHLQHPSVVSEIELAATPDPIMQQTADYFRPYDLQTAHHHHNTYTAALYHAGHISPAAAAAASARLTPMDHQVIGGDRSSFLAAASPYHQHLYTGGGYGSTFDTYQMAATTHIPLNDQFQAQQQQHSQLRNYPARPQPTRPLLVGSSDLAAAAARAASAAAAKESMPAPANPLHVNQTPPPPSSAMAARSQNSSKDKANNNSNNHTFSNNSSSNNNHSPMAASPANAPLSPADSKFRYPSGPSGTGGITSVQSSHSSSAAVSPGCSAAQSPGGRVSERTTTTPSSAMSSREGTPLPGNMKGGEDAAPNIDISTVDIKDGSALGGGYSAPSSAFAQSNSGFHSFSSTSAMSSRVGGPYSSFYSNALAMDTGGSGATLTDHSMHSVTLPQRGLQQGYEGQGVAPVNAVPGSTRSHVKIGRRPAHLPKVLKFSDSTLPPNWIRKLKQRKHGKQAGRWDVYIYSPCGVKFASRKKLKGFFEKNNLNHDPEDFDFTPYGRHMDSRAQGSDPGRTGGGAGGGNDASSVGRHNSAASTGSDGTHPGSSPSMSNYSPIHASSSAVAHGMMGPASYMPPSHHMALSASSSAALGFSGFSSSAATMMHSASVVSPAGCDYGSFAQFDRAYKPYPEGMGNLLKAYRAGDRLL
jgi:hypothetical protein